MNGQQHPGRRTRPETMHASGFLRACVAILTGLASIACVVPATAQPAAPAQPAAWGAETWAYALTPYVWLPTINANIEYPLPGGGGSGGGGTGGAGGGGSSGLLDGVIDTEIGPNDYLTKLNFALMLTGEARRGRWSILADFIGMRASGEGTNFGGIAIGGAGGLLPGDPIGANIDTGTTTTLKVTLWNVVGGYNLVSNDRYRLDAIAGVRFGKLDATLDWRLSAAATLPDGTQVLDRSGTLDASRSPFDGVIGVRGRYRLDERWAFPYYLDVGAGSSRLTWQAFAGASYAFGWGELLVAYRHLNLQDESNQVFRKLTLSGPSIGATFRF